jgi:hypothetical protein
VIHRFSVQLAAFLGLGRVHQQSLAIGLVVPEIISRTRLIYANMIGRVCTFSALFESSRKDQNNHEQISKNMVA